MQAGLDLLQVRLVVEILRVQVLLTIDGAMIRILENPHLSTAFGRVELCRHSENFQEDALRYIFRLSRIANDFQSNAQDKAVVAVEQNRKSVVAATL